MDRKHRCFEATTPGGATIRINGDPAMSQATLDALMALADAAFAHYTNPHLTPTEFRADGWPLCPRCGEDELWSPLAWNGDGERPPIAAYIAAGLRCYLCGWSQEPTKGEPTT